MNIIQAWIVAHWELISSLAYFLILLINVVTPFFAKYSGITKALMWAVEFLSVMTSKGVTRWLKMPFTVKAPDSKPSGPSVITGIITWMLTFMIGGVLITGCIATSDGGRKFSLSKTLSLAAAVVPAVMDTADWVEGDKGIANTMKMTCGLAPALFAAGQEVCDALADEPKEKCTKAKAKAEEATMEFLKIGGDAHGQCRW